MNILFISRCPPYPLHLGDRLILWHLARELSQRGHTLDVLAFTQYPTDNDEKQHYAAFFREIYLLPETRRTPFHYLQRVLFPKSRFPQRAGQAWSTSMWHAIEQQLNRQQYDVVHLFGSVQVYEFFHVLRGLPTIITPYESYSLYLQRAIAKQNSIINQARRIIAMQLERWMFAPYARTIVVAQPDKDELLRLNPDLSVEVISNGIDLDFFTGGERIPESAALLFVGNYEYPPNVEAAFLLANHILPQVHQALPEAKLLLVGNAPPPELIALNSDFITVTGRVPDIRPYQAQATAFVCPLQTGAGIKNKVLEALAAGVPVVATSISADGIAVEHDHSVIIAEVDHFAEEVIRLLRDTELQQTLSRNGRHLVENYYTWTQVAERYEAVYRAVASQKQQDETKSNR